MGLLIEKIDLPNGLVVELYDCSRRIAGDRWYVKLLARASVRVTSDAFAHLSECEAMFREFLDTRGELVYFDKEFERNFIDQREKDGLLREFVERLKKDALSYIGRPEFIPRLIRRQVNDFLEKRNWWR
ncbi:MAG: hypothetical protein ACP5J5_06435 [Dissulfurimicrobium sp.]|uniref:hypothetical protein n=1 Tax=Dissulfurimicrobium TaxID=1769732 RepID=UPI001EDC2ACC|nr:hypothetical protein [Dissulfurimicrobium hydrothermale]UKL14148.1 hypothetical protein LGS26_02530 [Dissulfurimicrobium hydrothermale]